VIITQLYKNFIKPEYCLELIMRFSHDEFETLKQEAKGSKETISLALIGAVEYFSKKHMLAKKQKRILMIKVLKSHLDLSAKELSRYYARAASFNNSDKPYQYIVKGAKTAKQWLNYQSGKKGLLTPKRLNTRSLLAS
jgi:cellobiose phosphorylase